LNNAKSRSIKRKQLMFVLEKVGNYFQTNFELEHIYLLIKLTLNVIVKMKIEKPKTGFEKL